MDHEGSALMATVTQYMGLTKWDSLNDFFSHAQLAANFQAIDQHDHTAGAGKKIPAGGLAALSIITGNLQDGVVTAAKLADGAVISRKIADGAVTAAKLAPNAALSDDLLASPNNGVYYELGSARAYIVNGTGSSGTYLMDSGTAGTPIKSGTSTAPSLAPTFFYFDDADYTVSGKTQKLRVRSQALLNATDPTITFKVGLYPISSVAGSTGQISYTVGSVTPGSEVTFTAPTNSTRNQGNSTDFDIPGDGYYTLAVNLSGTAAASSVTALAAQLQAHYV